MKKKTFSVLLIQPPIQDFYCTPIRSFPLGLCYLASALERVGHNVSILDAVAGGRKARGIEDPAFAYLDSWHARDASSPYGLFSGLKHYGLTFDAIRASIAECRPDVVGVSSLFSAYADAAIRVCREAKSVSADILTVIGGAHIYEYGAYVLKQSSDVDFALKGEGEETFPQLLDSIDHPEDVSNVVYRGHSGIQESDASFPATAYDDLIPARHLLDLDQYRIGKKRYTPLITSRGCPHECGFCAIPQTWGKRLRVRSPESVKKEVQACYDEYAMRIFDIEDDNFTANRTYAVSVLEGLIDLQRTRTFEVTAMNGLYYKTIDNEILGLLAKAGMERLNISLVSSSSETGTESSRHLDRDAFDCVVRAAHARGMHITAYFIIALPGETVAAMIDSLLYLSTLPVLIGPSIYYHVPGSPLFRTLEDEGEVHREDYPFFRSSALYRESSLCDRADMATLFYLTRLVNYVKGKSSGQSLSASLAQYAATSSPQNDVSDEALIVRFARERVFYARDRSATMGALKKLPQSPHVIEQFFRHLSFM